MRMAGARGPQTGRGRGKTADLVLRIQALFVAGGQVLSFKANGGQGSSSILTNVRQTQSRFRKHTINRAYLFHRDGKNHSAGKTKRREVTDEA